MSIVTLPTIYLRTSDSMAIDHLLKINDTAADMTGWTVRLYVNRTLLKTITTATDGATIGLIKNQGTNPGEYYFTIVAGDLDSFVDCRKVTLNCYVQYVTDDVTPPSIFSNVEFDIVLSSV